MGPYNISGSRGSVTDDTPYYIGMKPARMMYSFEVKRNQKAKWHKIKGLKMADSDFLGKISSKLNNLLFSKKKSYQIQNFQVIQKPEWVSSIYIQTSRMQNITALSLFLAVQLPQKEVKVMMSFLMHFWHFY